MSDKKITIALMSCGEHTEKECLEAIKPFRDKVEFLEIRNVYPQFKALNQMISMIDTEFFIPLDADMILKNDAWPRIINAVHKHEHDPKWFAILFSLFDTLLERKILALKVLRTSILKENPFYERPTPDVEHYQRLTALGYHCVTEFLPLREIGDHVVKGHRFCYFKFRDVYQTYKMYNYAWDSGVFLGGQNLHERAKIHFDYFLLKWIKTNNLDYLYCIAGMIDGILSPLEVRSKDLNTTCRMKIDPHEGVGVFLNWYLPNFYNKTSSMLLF